MIRICNLVLIAAAAFAALAGRVAAGAPQPSANAAVRAVIADWYAELKKGDDSRPRRLFAPGAIIASRSSRRDSTPHSRAAHLVGPPFPRELIHRAEKFTYDIEELVVENRLAKARVWERGWIYAWAAKVTYRNDAEARFVFERQTDGTWKILAFGSNSEALSRRYPEHPMPDLSPEGKAKADAESKE